MSEAIKAFNKAAESYDDWYGHPQGRQIFEAELKLIESMVPSEGLGLEIGAGTGIFAERLSNGSLTIVCLDPSRKMLAKARDREIITAMGVGENLPFRRDVMEFTYMVTVIEFLEDPAEVFSQVRDIAKPNAPVILIFINSESPWGRFYKDLGSGGDPVFRHANIYCFNEVRDMFSGVSYRIVDEAATLTTSPFELEVGGEAIQPGPDSGVIIVKAVPS